MSEPSSFRLRPSALSRAWPWLAALTSGGLLTLCFPRWDQGWLAWLALTPLICAAFFSHTAGRRVGLRKAALGFVAGLVFFTSTFHWLSTTLSELYQNPWLLALAPLVALVFGFYFAFWTWFIGAVLVRADAARKFPRSLSNLATAAAGASAWVAHEWVRERLFGGFGWNGLGVALHRDLPMIQIAEFTGVPGLSFLVVFANLMAVIVVRRIIGEIGPVFLKRVRWEFSLSIALIVLVWAYGVRQLWRNDLGPGVPLRVVAVQPNIPQTEKFDPAMQERIFSELAKLTGLAAATRPAAQLVLWPESSTPRSMFADDESYHFVLAQARALSGALLLGSTEFDPDTLADYNIAALLTPRAGQPRIYRKMHLVPFGEYLPLRPVFEPFCGELVPSDFRAGTEFTVFDLPDPRIRIAALICFEDTLGELTRRFVQKGAQALVNLTNDGWFAQSAAAEQHLANAVLRAVENRRPLIRCGNTGVTCAVDAYGRVDRWLRPFQQGFAARDVHVPTAGPLTFYTRHGDWLSHLSMLATAGVLVRALFAWWRGRGARRGSLADGAASR